MSAIRSLLMASVAIAMSSTAMSSAVMAQDVTVLRIGLDGGENEADQIRRSECLVDSMKAATGVSEVQFFPSPDYNGVIQGLLALGAEVCVADSHVGPHPIHVLAERVDLTADQLAAADAVVLVTDHDDVDYDLVVSNADYVLDTRNRLRAPNVEPL